MEKRVCIGKIVAAHGIRGGVKVRSINQNPLDLDQYGVVENADASKKFFIKVVGLVSTNARVKIEGVNTMPDVDNEWFELSPKDSKFKFYEFRENHGITCTKEIVVPYKLRKEQDEAVRLTLDYANTHKNGEFLWNAKPRFGKTLSTYDFVKQGKFNKVLIVTNRPAIANSWFHK